MVKETFYNLTNDLSQEVESIVQENPELAENSYVQGFQAFFSNKVSVHINYTNFKLISKYLGALKDKPMNILDLGCGFGDKSYNLKQLFRESKVHGVETINHDDPNQKKAPPHQAFTIFYPYFQSRFGIDLSLYDGLELEFPDDYFDVIVLYAVIEHIAPEKRRQFIKEISKKLKKDGHIVITRCPRKYSLTEIVASRLGLDHHPWRLSRPELLQIFDEDEFDRVVLKSISNIPSQPQQITQRISPVLIPADYVLQSLRWPLASDYFLIEKKL